MSSQQGSSREADDGSGSRTSSFLPSTAPASNTEPIVRGTGASSSSSSSSSVAAPPHIEAKHSIGSNMSIDSDMPVLVTAPVIHEAPRYVGNSLFLFPSNSTFRLWCISVISNRYFKWFILLAIIGNSIFLAIDDPLKGEKEDFNAVTHYADYVFLAIFATEAVLKIISMGLILHSRSYLRDGWNWIDLIVVIVSIVGVSSSAGNLTAMRALRLLRPLRTISRVRGMQIIVNSVLKGAANCLGVLVLVFVVYVIFGGAAVQLWEGVLHNQCYLDTQVANNVPEYPLEFAPPGTRFCSRTLDGYKCPAGQTCLPAAPNPGCGYLNFDDIGHTWLTMYIVMTFDDWPRTMYRLQDAWSNEAFIWFLLFCFVTVFFILNLTLASVEESFSEEREQRVEDEREKKLKIEELKKQFRAQGMTKQQAAAAAKGRADFWKYLKLLRPRKHTIWNMPDNPFSKKLRSLFHMEEWDYFIIAMIVLNAFIMALDHYPQSYAWDRLQVVSNILFTVLFGVEMVLKLIAYGPYGYLTDGYNILDGTLVIFSVIDLAASFVNFKAFRVFRLLRAGRLFKKFESMQVIILMVKKSLSSLFYISVVLLLFLFIFAVLGRQLFAGTLRPPPEGAEFANCAGNPGDLPPRSNYDSFWEAFVTTFQISIYDDWSKTMYMEMSATTNWAVIFFVLQTMLSTFILNLFVAMLMHAFEDAQEEIEKIKAGKMAPPDEDLRSSVSKNDMSSATDLSLSSEAPAAKRAISLEASMLQLKVVGGKVRLEMLDENEIAAYNEQLKAEGEFEIGIPKPVRRIAYHVPPELSLHFFSTQDRVRKFCITLIQSRIISFVIFFVIILSCVFLAMDQPDVRDDSPFGKVIYGFNFFFAFFFIAEAVIKIIALGLYQHKGAYLRDPWNVLDLVITVLTIISLGEPSWRLVRAFRAIRLLTFFESTRNVVHAFMKALIPIANILIVVGVVWIAYAILGVQLWKGEFYSCTDPLVNLQDNCNGTFVDSSGAVVPRRWTTPNVNFNNVGQAILILARTGTSADWLIPVWAAEDAVSIGHAPQRYHNPGAAAYFISFTIMGGFFTLSMFVAALIDQFHEQNKKLSGSAFLNDAQNLWLTFTRIVVRATPEVRIRIPQQRISRICYYITQSPLFDPTMMALIGLNVIVMLTSHYPASAGWIRFWNVMNFFFLLVFLVEAILKIAALGIKGYFNDSWNIFDFVIVLLTVAGGLAELFIDVPGSPSFLRALRSLRMLRVFRFIPRLREFVDTLIFIIPSAFNVLMLWAVVWFIFAIIGMNIMGEVPICDLCNFNPRSNFATFGRSVLTVFVMMTAEGWANHMTEAALTNRAYYLFYMALIVFVMLILLNLFIAVMMEEFSSFKNARHEKLKLDSFQDFAVLWARKDPYGDKRILAMDLVPLLYALGEPLGFSATMPRYKTFAALELMDVPIYSDKTVRYEHVLQGLVRWGLQLNMRNMRFNYRGRDITRYTIAHLYATQMLQKVFRRRRAMMKIARTVELAHMKPTERALALSGERPTAPPNISPRLTKEEARKKEKKRRKQEEREHRRKEAAVAGPSPRSPRTDDEKDKRPNFHKARPV